jgi:WD40 repeat protein/tRNA A-37 threonylcarbamoyl transferase component Bud32
MPEHDPNTDDTLQLEETDPRARADTLAPSTTAGADTMLADLDTPALRNLVHQRIFGQVVDPLRIGRFPILRRLGQGGMGIVYAAYDNELDRKIAIKLLRPAAHTTDAAEELRTRLLREAKAMARVSHPNVVQVYEAGEHDDQVYVAMEFVDGITLRRWLEAESRRPREIVTTFIAAGRGLAAAHAAGLVHRDFKPDNVVVGHDGRVRVLDFGLAVAGQRALPEGLGITDEELPSPVLDRLTRTGTLLGTPAYMAPEQFGAPTSDARVDQFALGVALFEALCGELPFPGKSFEQLRDAVRAGKIVWPSRRPIPPRVQRVLRRSLAVDPEDRHQSMEALVEALQRSISNTGRNVGLVLGGLGVLVGTAGGLFGNMLDEVEARVGRLSQEVQSERTRAEDAELRLQQRADALTLAEARSVLPRDPTRAVALLHNLSPDAEAWTRGAWAVAQAAADAGIAQEVISLPEGWTAKSMVDPDALVLTRVGISSHTEALWLRSTGELRELGNPLEVGFARNSPKGTYLVQVGEPGIVIHTMESGEHRRLVDGKEVTGGMFPGCNWRIAFTPDERFLLTTCGDGLQRWDTRTWEGVELLGDRFERCAQRTERHSSWCMSAWVHAVSDTGTRVFTETEDLGTMLVDVETGMRHRFGLGAENSFLASSPDGRLAALASGENLQIHETDTGRSWTHDVDTIPQVAAFDREGQRLAFGTRSGSVYVLEQPQRGDSVPRRLLGGHDSQLVALQWSSDGRLHSIGRDDTIVLWDLDAGSRQTTLRGLAAVKQGLWTDPGTFWALGRHELRRYAVPEIATIATGTVHAHARDGIVALAYPDGRVTWSSDSGLEAEVEHPSVEHVMVGPKGKRIATGGGEQVRVWTPAGVLEHEADGHTVGELAFDPTGKTLAASSFYAPWFVDLSTGKRHDFDGPREANRGRFAFSPDGMVHTPVREDGELVMLSSDAVTGALVSTTPFEEVGWNAQRGFAFIDASHPFAFATAAGDVVLFDAEGRRRSELPGLGKGQTDNRELVSSPDGRLLLLTGIADPAYLWDLRSGQTYEPPLGGTNPEHGGRGYRAAIHRASFVDERTVIEVSLDGLVRRWRISVPLEPDALRHWVAGATDFVADSGALGETASVPAHPPFAAGN